MTGARILVVDDEPLVRDLVREVLVREGHTVLHADTAEHALALVRSAGPAPDLVVTDLTMPGMDGVTLARTLRAAYPGIGALLMSGSPADHESGLEAAGERFHFLQKPFSIETLRRAVAHALPAHVRRDRSSEQSHEDLLNHGE